MIKFLIFELDKIILQAIMHNSIYVTITGLKCQYVKKKCIDHSWMIWLIFLSNWNAGYIS